MRALTVKQPWAGAIALGAVHPGGKDVENRHWSTGYRGPLLIHAGKAVDEAGLGFEPVRRLAQSDEASGLHTAGVFIWGPGAVVCQVDLVDVHLAVGCARLEGGSCWPWGQPVEAPPARPVYHWCLAAPRVAVVNDVRGMLGLWHVPPSLLERVEAAHG